MFDILDISASALTAQRVRMDTIAQNVANINTTRDAAGRLSPFRRRMVTFAAGQAEDPNQPGVHVGQIKLDPAPFRKVLDWNHPDHDAEGFVNYPNIDTATEMVNALEASRAYEANITTMDVTKAMLNASLRILA